jgi:hypothetical protein
MRTLALLTVLSAIALVSQAILGPDSTVPRTASMPWHLMLCFGLYGIAVLGSRLAQAGPDRIARSAPNPPRRMALTRTAATIVVAIIALAPSSAGALPITSLAISEVMFNPSGADDQREWVELYNGTAAAIDLAGYSLGWGGADYTTGTLQLSGIIASGATFVAGGPISDGGNGNPTYDLPIDFGPNLQNGGIFADGLALFNVPATSITSTTVPTDAVIYGIINFAGLIDETGAPGAVDFFGFGPAGASIEITDGGWVSQPLPGPGTPPMLIPQPGTSITLGMGLAMLAMGRRRARVDSGPRCAAIC